MTSTTPFSTYHDKIPVERRMTQPPISTPVLTSRRSTIIIIIISDGLGGKQVFSVCKSLSIKFIVNQLGWVVINWDALLCVDDQTMEWGSNCLLEGWGGRANPFKRHPSIMRGARTQRESYEIIKEETESTVMASAFGDWSMMSSALRSHSWA